MKKALITAMLLTAGSTSAEQFEMRPGGVYAPEYNPSRAHADANADSINTNNAVSNSNSYSRGGSSNQNQGQEQGQSANNAQGQQQGQINEDLVNLDLSNNSKVNNPNFPVAQAYAPGLVVGGSEMCVGSVSAGGQGASFGFSVGATVTDDACIRRKDSRFLANTGYRRAACELMRQKEDVAEAFESAGYDCNMIPYSLSNPAPSEKLIDKDEEVMGSKTGINSFDDDLYNG